MHLPEPHRVPKFRGEVAAFLDLFFVETNVLPARRNPHKTEAQPVGAVLINQLERIRRVAEALRHLAPLLVPNESGKENIAERNVVFDAFRFTRLKLEAGNDHARDPEENDVRRGYEPACRI